MGQRIQLVAHLGAAGDHDERLGGIVEAQAQHLDLELQQATGSCLIDELRDAELWAAMWERALDCVRWYQLPASTMGRISIREAEANTRRWNERIGEHRDWLELEEPGVIDRFVRQPSAALGRILRRLGS